MGFRRYSDYSDKATMSEVIFAKAMMVEVNFAKATMTKVNFAKATMTKEERWVATSSSKTKKGVPYGLL